MKRIKRKDREITGTNEKKIKKKNRGPRQTGHDRRDKKNSMYLGQCSVPLWSHYHVGCTVYVTNLQQRTYANGVRCRNGEGCDRMYDGGVD